MPASDPSPPEPPPASTPPWRLRLLGAVQAERGSQPWRPPSRAATLLLGRLALWPARDHPREELVELLWPGTDQDVGRNRLRQALSVLKSSLEAPGQPPVILADRLSLRAAPGALACDATDFERHLRSGQWDLAEPLYGGELLPGFYDEWVLEERARLATLAERLQTRPRVASTRSTTAPVVPAMAGPLPAYWTRLFGTEDSCRRLVDLVRGQRLVTVVGAGGSGKTRLAVEAARGLQPGATPPDMAPFERVVFVSLVDCSDSARALDAIASVLGVQGRDPQRALVTALAAQRTLLLLDNCEQLVAQAHALLQPLLAECATLHVLVTSRVRLNVDGEHVMELAGLPVPPPAADQEPDRSRDDPAGQAAVALFIDRARAVAPGCGDAAPQRQDIARLVRLLAGMPLAIELAASRMRSLTPGELLGLLTQGKATMLDLLARETPGQAADAAAQRHASLRQVVTWSWRQLPPPLVEVMQAVATFAAPARPDTIAAVASLPVQTARERLAQLQDHSLVLAERDSAGTLRHVLLQPVREFVVENTPAAVLQQLRTRLRDWLLAFGREQAALGQASIETVQAELGLVTAAVLDAAADGPAALRQAVEIAVALRRHWEIDTRAGLPPAVTRTLLQALPLVEAADLRCDASVLLAFTQVMAGHTAHARTLAENALALASDPRRRAHALLRLSQVVVMSPGDQSSADGLLAEAVRLAQDTGDLEVQALAMRMQFLVAVNRDNDRTRGEALAERVQALWEQLGHRRNAYSGLMDRASCWLSAGRLDEAATALAACEHAARQEGYATGHIMASWQLGRALLQLRQPPPALAAFRRCLRESWRHTRLAYVADALVLLPGGLALCGQAETAARLQGFAVANWQRQFGPFYREMERDVCRTRRWLRSRLGAVRVEALRLEGLGLSLAQAVALALADEAPAAGEPAP